MKSIYLRLLLILAVLIGVPCIAQDDNAKSPKRVVDCYPNLPSGVLTYAKIVVLPEGVLLKADEVEIFEKEIEQFISEQPKQFVQNLRKNAFFVLETLATNKLLLKIAKQEYLKENKSIDNVPDQNMLATLFKNLTKNISVTEQDIETFYKENESLFCGTPLESVRKYIEPHVTQNKRERYIDQYIQTLGQKAEIFVSDSWTKIQESAAKENPLDKARTTGKPTIAIFSASSCCGPDKMLPVKEALLQKYGTKINIVYIEPKEDPVLAARYGIRSIPAQVLYDTTGKEFFRHNGFFSEKDISDRLNTIGMK